MAFIKSKEQKEQEALEKYGLQNLSNPTDIASVQKIINELLGTGLMEAGLKLGLAKAEVQLPIALQRAMVEQNWIIIRQLDKISQQLDKLN